MPRRARPKPSPQDIASDAGVVFLALHWSGGGPLDLSNLIFAYDAVNRSVLRPDEMEAALNHLIVRGLVVQSRRKYAVPADVDQAFTAFRKRQRRDRWEQARAFVAQHAPRKPAIRRIRIANETYQTACRGYAKAFDNHLKERSPPASIPKVPKRDFYAGKRVAQTDWFLQGCELRSIQWARRRTFTDGSADVACSARGTLFGFATAAHHLLLDEYVLVAELARVSGDLDGVPYLDLVPPEWPAEMPPRRFRYLGDAS